MQPMKPVLSQQLVVPYIREADYAVRKPWFIHGRKNLDYLLIYVEEGRCNFHVEGTDYDMEKGDFCLIQPGQYHTRILDALLRLIRMWQSQHPLKQLEVQYLGMELFLGLLHQFSNAKPSDITVSPTLDWIPSYLALHLAEPLSVKDIAVRAKLSPSRFNAVFRQYYGVAPHRYLLKLRVQHARMLLTTTDYNIADIAEYCEFANIHHFSRVFKKLTSLTQEACDEVN
jgi:AraC-like DNA-binding protein